MKDAGIKLSFDKTTGQGMLHIYLDGVRVGGASDWVLAAKELLRIVENKTARNLPRD